MAEARQLRRGRWRIYHGPALDVARDPQTGAIAFFDSLDAAQRWWARQRPDLEAPLVDPIHHLRADAGRRQPSPTGYRTAGRFRHEQFLERDRLIVEPGELDDAQDLPPAIGQTPDMHQ